MWELVFGMWVRWTENCKWNKWSLVLWKSGMVQVLCQHGIKTFIKTLVWKNGLLVTSYAWGLRGYIATNLSFSTKQRNCCILESPLKYMYIKESLQASWVSSNNLGCMSSVYDGFGPVFWNYPKAQDLHMHCLKIDRLLFLLDHVQKV